MEILGFITYFIAIMTYIVGITMLVMFVWEKIKDKN